jgi:hypothetical protein
MTHPGWEDERAILLDPAWVDLLSSRRLGCYSDLEAPGPRLARLRRAAAGGKGERRG